MMNAAHATASEDLQDTTESETKNPNKNDSSGPQKKEEEGDHPKLRKEPESISETDPADALELWQKWVPMDPTLYQFLHTAQLAMLQKIHELFQQADNNIPYWICGGTLMGAIRHGGLIPHDDDVDIECYQHDLERIAQLPVDDFYSGFIPRKGTWNGHVVAKLLFWNGMLEVDVFPRPSPLPEGDRHFPSQPEVFPRSLYTFDSNNLLRVWGPNREQCGEYLDRCYGPDWRDTVCVYNHDYNWYHGAGFDPRKQVLSLTRYNAIVQRAGVLSSLLQIESTAQATVERMLEQHGSWEHVQEKYNQYKRQRVFRWNRAAAEYREMLQEQRQKEQQQLAQDEEEGVEST
ncbi:transferase activity [Seminavis robusta]|uniref:Transferase activity n=1 Tax=Seminavis robusta TaxID=568900 RepID=A0A9N8HDL9_9STRA|nr:transferase activity [Seminavis robusta]|eukprot:Sro434_g141950.1 transferase activity (347) ;mRNA; f:3979-5019